MEYSTTSCTTQNLAEELCVGVDPPMSIGKISPIFYLASRFVIVWNVELKSEAAILTITTR